MQNLPQNEQREPQESKFQIIGQSFGFLMNGIAWVSLEIASIILLSRIVGIIFILISLILIIVSCSNRLSSRAETHLRNYSIIIWPIIVASVVVALSLALKDIGYDWRVSMLIWAVFICFFLTVVSLFIVIISHIRRGVSRLPPKIQVSGSKMKQTFLKMANVLINFGLWATMNRNWIAFVGVFIFILCAVYIGNRLSIILALVLPSIITFVTKIDWHSIDWAFVVAVIAVIISVSTLAIVGWQTRLIKKQIFGELYKRAQIKDLCFILPEYWKHHIVGFKQSNEDQIILGKYMAVPVGLERELHIRWQMAKSQTLRGYIVGFRNITQDTPKIIETVRLFPKKTFQEFTREQYIDWHGDFHCEYAHPRRLFKDEYFLTTIRVKGMVAGKYTMVVVVQVNESPEAFEGDLTVECIDLPNDWCKEHWAQDYL